MRSTPLKKLGNVSLCRTSAEINSSGEVAGEVLIKPCAFLVNAQSVLQLMNKIGSMAWWAVSKLFKYVTALLIKLKSLD